MSGAWVQTRDVQTASGTAVTVTLTTTAGNLLDLATVTFGAATAAATVSNGAAVSNAVADFASTVDTPLHQRQDYQPNIAGGSTVVTFHAAASSYITGNATEFSGCATSTPLGAVNHAGSSATVASQQPGSITPAAGSAISTATGDDSGSTAADTINQSFTVRSDATGWNGANQRGGVATLDNAAGTALNPTWTLPSGSQAMLASIVEYKQASGGGTVALTATLAGVGSLTANPYIALTTTLAGVGSLVASLVIALSATLAGAGSLAASLYVTLTAALAGVGSLTAHLIQNPQALSTTLAGVGSLAANLTGGLVGGGWIFSRRRHK